MSVNKPANTSSSAKLDTKLDTKQQQAARDRLLVLKAEYENRIAKIDEHIQHPADDLNQHWEDQAVIASQNDMRNNLLLEAQQNLSKVNDALLRLDNNAYGICAECGEVIEEKRLEAVPYATLCMQHAL